MKITLALLLLSTLAITAIANQPKIQVVQLEGLKINEGLVTDEIVKRFDTKATGINIAIQRQGVEDRIRGLFAASLAPVSYTHLTLPTIYSV